MSNAHAPAAQLRATDLHGELRAGSAHWPVRVVGVYPHTLLISFPEPKRPTANQVFDGLHIPHPGGSTDLDLGKCSFAAHPSHPLRRADDLPPEPGDGRLVFLEAVYDFAALLRDGVVSEIQQKLQQLPLIWQRKEGIRPQFRDYTADLVYDIQAYRLLLDEIDRDLAHEPVAVRARIRHNAVTAIYPDFARFFDQRLDRLSAVVGDLSRQDHERHGFYFRKHVWDLILSSPFLARTNLKPRGYAGDSEMMQMVYEDTFRGGTLFSMCLHRHPIQSAAAQAVRNRRRLIAETLHARLSAMSERRVRVLSVACGPAAELTDVVRTPEDARRFEFVLLDQDPTALAEAAASAAATTKRLGQGMMVQTVQESVRTMLHAGDLSAAWGRFDIVYTMGLFDYLQPPVARVVLSKLYDLLLPGGELIVGNFHMKNPTRTYMEYWMDWVLVYRSEDEMLGLAVDLPGAATELSYEQTRSQMFLRIRRTS